MKKAREAFLNLNDEFPICFFLKVQEFFPPNATLPFL